jgi:hypothetical protein
LSRTPNSLPLEQWEIEEAQRLRGQRLAWKTIAHILQRDRTGLARAVQKLSRESIAVNPERAQCSRGTNCQRGQTKALS